jgi:hypothetical protein
MITNFAEFFNAVKTDYERRFELSVEEIENLRKKIDSWNDEKFDDMSDVFEMYGISNVSLDLMKILCKKYLRSVALELYAGGITDTDVRENLISCLIRELGISGAWPTYGTAKNKAEEFWAKFAMVGKVHNITFSRG